MLTASQAFGKFLKAHGWPYHVSRDGRWGGLVIGKCGRWSWRAFVEEDDGFLVFYGIVPLNVPPECRPAAAEYLGRANAGLRWGNFEMNYDTGRVEFRTTAILERRRVLSQNTIEHVVFGNSWVVHRYLPGLMRVVFGGVSPEQAVADAEQPEPAGDAPAPASEEDPEPDDRRALFRLPPPSDN